MKRGVIAGVVVAILGGIALWAWMPAPHDGVVLAKTARATAASTTASAGQGGAWALLAEATRQADAAEPQGRRFCGAPFMDEGAEPTDAMNERLDRHIKDSIAAQARRLAVAPDDMGRLTGAILGNDVARIAEIGRTTSDPAAYGLALRSCRQAYLMALYQEDPTRFLRDDPESRKTPTACTALSAQRWTELDPDNAAAWWTLASQSTTQEAALKAMIASKSATRVVGTQGQLITRIAVDGPVDPAALLPVSIMTIGLDVAELALSSSALRRACGSKPPADPSARAVCQDLALNLADKDPGLIGRTIVSNMAVNTYGVPTEQLPYSPEVLRKLAVEFDAWRAPESAKGNHDMGCRQTARLIEADIERAKVGEIAILQRLGKMPPRSRAAVSAPAS